VPRKAKGAKMHLGQTFLCSYVGCSSSRSVLDVTMSMVNVGSVTTIFTPPPTCLAVITSVVDTSVYASGYSAFVGNFGGNYLSVATSCYPSTTVSINFWDNYYWSPGICPSGYTPACSFIGGDFGPGVTASLCCPRSVEGNVLLFTILTEKRVVVSNAKRSGHTAAPAQRVRLSQMSGLSPSLPRPSSTQMNSQLSQAMVLYTYMETVYRWHGRKQIRRFSHYCRVTVRREA
jgi:hypothetical protein